MSLKYGEIIKQMSLEEKALMMSGKNTWETVDFEKYGIPSMAMSDGPHGLRRQVFLSAPQKIMVCQLHGVLKGSRISAVCIPLSMLSAGLWWMLI